MLIICIASSIFLFRKLQNDGPVTRLLDYVMLENPDAGNLNIDYYDCNSFSTAAAREAAAAPLTGRYYLCCSYCGCY